MNEDSGSVKKLTHEEIKEKTWPGQTGLVGAGFGPSPKQTLSFLMPLVALSMMDPVFGDPIPVFDRKRHTALDSRQCALPGCDVYFTPKKESECCCSKEHFLQLRELQKQKAKE